MSDADTSGFGKFVPGFDFLQNLAKGASQNIPQMPNLANWVAPTLNVEELEKRIDELKAVHFWLDQNGKALGDPAKLPWCGDLVESVIAKTLPTEPLVSNPFWALNWSKFGKAIKVVAVGNILTFKRNGGGHVGFCVGHDATHFHVLGGNQSNAVTITRIAKDRLLRGGMRWPHGPALPAPNGVARPWSAALSVNEA